MLTPDDVTRSRGATKKSPRDNLILELGVFLGGLGVEPEGRQRTFAMVGEHHQRQMKIPSDFSGISLLTYKPAAEQHLESMLGKACTQINDAVKKHGVRRQIEMP